MPKCKYPNIKKIFKALREEKKFTQDELAQKIGICKPAISNLENGLKEPSLLELKAYSKYFNCPMEYLLGLNDSRTYTNYNTSSELGLSDKAIEILKMWNNPNYNNVKKNRLLLLNLLLEQAEYYELFELLYEYLFNLPETFSIDLDTIDCEAKKQDVVYVNNKDGGGFSIHKQEIKRFIMLSIQDKLNDLRHWIIQNKYDELIPKNGMYRTSNYIDILEKREKLIYGEYSNKKK